MPPVFKRGPLTANSNNYYPYYSHQVSGLPTSFTKFLFDKKHYNTNSKSVNGIVHTLHGIEYSLDAATKLSLELLFFNNPDRLEKEIWIAVQQFFSKTDNSKKYEYICAYHIHQFNECVHPQLSICYQPSGKVDILATEITKNYPYIEKKTLSLACQENVNHSIRLLQNKNHVIILTNQYTWDIARRIIACIPLLFETLKPQHPLLTDLFIALGKSDDEAWYQIAQKYLKHLDYENTLYKQQLTNLFQGLTDKEKARIHRNITDWENNIKSYLQNINSAYDALQQLKKQELLLTLNPESTHSDLIEFLLTNKSIKNITCDPQNGTLLCSITTPLANWDAAFYQHLSQNQRSSINRSKFTSYICDKIFKTEEYKFIVTVNIKVNLLNKTFNTVFPEQYDTGFPHPHLATFNCFGNNGPLLTKALKEGDYIGFYSQVIGANFNINWADNTVINHLTATFNDEYSGYNNYHCILKKDDDKLYTINEIRKEFEENETN